MDPSTASRVLRGDPAQHVRPDTRQRILSAARELEYRPNALARSLRTRHVGTIGLVIPSLDNVGFAEVTHGIQRAAAEAGVLLLVVEADALPAEGTDHSHVVYDRLIGDGLVDGLIVAFATLRDHYLARLTDLGIPLVLVNRRVSGVSGSVVVDDLRGSRMAVEHLVELGHQRIGFIGLSIETDTAQRREQGYVEGVAAAGLRLRAADHERALPTVRGGHKAVDRLLRRASARPPTAVFVASLMSALGVCAALKEHGLRIPDDISIIAFNDHPIAEHLGPPLTAVRLPNLQMGQEAVRMLIGAIDGHPVGDVMIPEEPRIMVRASTAPPRLQNRGGTGSDDR